MKRTIALLLSLIIIFVCSGCAQVNLKAAALAAGPEYPESIAHDDYETRGAILRENAVSEDFLRAAADFSYKTASKAISQSEGNVCFSPISLYFALSLAASGAGGETGSELLELLGAGDRDVLTENSAKLYRLLYSRNELSTLLTANSVWMADELNGQKIKYKNDFLENAVADFYASLYSADFSSRDTADEMSKWVAENTGGLIKPVFEPDADLVMSIINAIYYKDGWADKFESTKTAPAVFHADNGDRTVDFMNKTAMGEYAEGGEWTRASLKMRSGGEMIFILPSENSSVGELVSSPGKLAEVLGGGEAKTGEIVWKIPKFDCASSFDLVPTLRDLGISDAFDENTADFSDITDDVKLFVSAIKQETFITIDEEGVEAAAYTKVDMETTGMIIPEKRIEMTLDRPFIYCVTAQNGMPLFTGVCVDFEG